MNLISAGIQYLTRPVRAMVSLGCICVLLGLNVAAWAGEPTPAAPQSNAVATGSMTEAPAKAMPVAPQAGTNRPAPAPIQTRRPRQPTCPKPPRPAGAAVLDDKHKLTIGDRLSFRIVEDEEDPKPLFVTDSGDLEVPYIGRVPAENKTCRQLAAEIKTALEKEYYYQAT